MSAPITSKPSSLDLSAAALFPDKAHSLDSKCLIIARLIQELAKSCDMSGVTQEVLQTNAHTRYTFLSDPQKLSLPEVDHKAFVLYQRGVTPQTAKEYFSYRLSKEDAAKWTIVPL